MYHNYQIVGLVLRQSMTYEGKHGKELFISCGCVLLFTNCNSVIDMLIMGLGLRQSLMVIIIYHWYPVICKSTYLPFILYYKSAFVVVCM